jgi:hypothetical protein
VETVGAPWLVFVLVATYRSIRTNPGQLPRPAIYAGSAVIYSGLALLAVSQRARPAVAVFAWALVLAQAVTGQAGEPGIPGVGPLLANPGAKAKPASSAQQAAAAGQAAGQGLGGLAGQAAGAVNG